MIFHPAHSFRHTTNATHDSLAGGLRVAATSGYCLATLRVAGTRFSVTWNGTRGAASEGGPRQ